MDTGNKKAGMITSPPRRPRKSKALALNMFEYSPSCSLVIAESSPLSPFPHLPYAKGGAWFSEAPTHQIEVQRSGSIWEEEQRSE